MFKKTFSLFICGMTLAISAHGQMRNNQGQLIPGRGPQILPPGAIMRPQETMADRIRRLSSNLAQQLDQKAGSLSSQDQNEVFELLRRVREIVKSGGDNEGPQLISSDAFAVSRKTGGEWITLKYEQPSDVSQLNLRGIGSGAIKIYAINFVTVSGQNRAIQTPTLDITGTTTLPVYSDVQEKVTHLQILAEGFRASMSLGIDSFGDTVGQPNLPPPGPILPPPPGPGPGPILPPQPHGRVTCVSKDNDGANPWIMAVREGVTDFRIAGTVFSNKQSCDAAIASVQYKSGLGLLCATKDNDGSNPYVLGVLDISNKAFNTLNKTLIFSNVTSCLKAVSDAVQSAGGVTLCSSKDRDGSNPYSLYFVDSNLGVQKGTETFSNYETCRSSL